MSIWSPVHALAVLLLIQLPDNGLGKAAGDDPILLLFF